jgi:hypothetical protein
LVNCNHRLGKRNDLQMQFLGQRSLLLFDQKLILSKRLSLKSLTESFCGGRDTAILPANNQRKMSKLLVNFMSTFMAVFFYTWLLFTRDRVFFEITYSWGRVADAVDEEVRMLGWKDDIKAAQSPQRKSCRERDRIPSLSSLEETRLRKVLKQQIMLCSLKRCPFPSFIWKSIPTRGATRLSFIVEYTFQYTFHDIDSQQTNTKSRKRPRSWRRRKLS